MSQARINPNTDLNKTAKDLLAFIENKANKKALEDTFKKAKEDQENSVKPVRTWLYEKLFVAAQKNDQISAEFNVYDAMKKLSASVWTDTSLNTFLLRELIKILPDYDNKAVVSLDYIKLINENLKLEVEKSSSAQRIDADNQALTSHFNRNDVGDVILSESMLNVAVAAAKDYALTKQERSVRKLEKDAAEQQSTATTVLQKLATQSSEPPVLSGTTQDTVLKRYEDAKEAGKQWSERTKEENNPEKRRTVHNSTIAIAREEMERVINQRLEREKQEEKETTNLRAERLANQAFPLFSGKINETYVDAWKLQQERTGAAESLAKFGGFSTKPVQKDKWKATEQQKETVKLTV